VGVSTLDKIKLANGIVYTIADYATPNSFVILLGTLIVSEVAESLTEENLSEIQFLTDSGAVTGTYHNKMLCDYVDNGDTLSININDVDLCRYGLILDTDNRIISAPAQRYAPDNAVIVYVLPDGNITDYLYINGEYVYDPLPKPLNFPVAPRNITKGEYITVNGVFYKTTANIPNGETIIVGQNAVVTTVEEQLYELTKGE
jgi:hypothetical protein